MKDLVSKTSNTICITVMELPLGIVELGYLWMVAILLGLASSHPLKILLRILQKDGVNGWSLLEKMLNVLS